MTNPRVLADFHHSSLLNSLIMLFEGRLGGQLYRPIGIEWYEAGFWKIYDHPATVQQYLGVGAATPDGTPNLNDVNTVSNGVYHCKDIDSGTTNKAITLQRFLSMPFDIVIASIPEHIEPFKRLCELHPNHPKLIYQIGNAWDASEGKVANVMASAVVPNVPEGVNFIEYHQEFDLNVFSKAIGDPTNSIASFVNVFSGQEHLAADWELFQKVEKAMPEWKFSSYGGQCRDGSIGPASELAKAMQSTKFIWHTKNGGDGYGHIVHNAAAVGRPLIVKTSYYEGKLAEKLMVDEVTCIAIDGLSIDQIKAKIDHFSQPHKYEAMCNAVYNQFKRAVDFDHEELLFREFLNNLK